MQPTFKELMAKAARAKQQGETEKAGKLVAAAKRLESTSQAPAEPLEESWHSGVADLGRGAWQGGKNVGGKAVELTARGLTKLGAEDMGGDLLTRLNTDRAASAAAAAPYRQRSPMAFGAGEIAGEILTTLPAGGLGGVAAKGAVNLGVRTATGVAARQGTKRMGAVALAGEGAAIGGLMSGGENLGQSAATGAAFDVAAGGAIGVATRFGGEAARRVMNGRQAQRDVADQLTPMQGRSDQAAADGGYNLPSTSAAATRESLQDYTDLRNSQDVGPDIIANEAQIERDVTERARQLTQRIPGGIGPEAPAPLEQVGVDMQRVLSDLREGDEANFRKLYADFDRLAAETSTPIDSSMLADRLAGVRAANTRSANTGLINRLASDTQRRGVGVDGQSAEANAAQDKIDAVYGTLRNGLGFGTRPNKKPLTLETLEDLIQDANSHWSPGMNKGHQRLLESYKNTIETFVDETLESMGTDSRVVSVAREARAARRAYSKDWTSKDLLEKLSTRTEGGDYAVDYSLALSSNNFSLDTYNKLKAKLMLNPVGTQVLESIRKAPLLEGLRRATADSSSATAEGGVIVFKHKEFERVVNKVPRKIREAMWGSDMVEEVDKTIAAWKLRDRKSAVPGNQNPSGTAFEVLRQLRFLQSGTGRNLGTATSGLAPSIVNAVNRPVRVQASRDILQGQSLPQRTLDTMRENRLDQLETEYVGANGREYGDVMRQFMRTGATLQFVDDEQ